MGTEIITILKKDFTSFFYSRLAYFMIAIYLILSMITTFWSGGYFQIDNSSLSSFFIYQPEIFILIIPALSMRLWADERRYGTIELLLTQPVHPLSIVLGKFFSACFFCLLLLFLTVPLWVTTAYFIETDNFHITINYIGCLLAIGFLCSISCCISSFCNGPISAYIMAIFFCAMVKQTNFDYFIKPFGYTGELAQKITQSLNFDAHYYHILQGQLGLDNVMFFCISIVIFLWFNVIAIDYKRG